MPMLQECLDAMHGDGPQVITDLVRLLVAGREACTRRFA
jgi:hypothetical protein